ncbi:MAG: DUF342 domain-containing protein [Planctomycetota bacterium]|jgi:uncharacterized protein (DUF342 family)
MPEEDNQEFQTVNFSGYKGISTTLNVIHEDITGDRFIRISVSPNRLHAFLEYEVINPEFKPALKDLKDPFSLFDIHNGLSDENFAVFMDLLNQKKAKIGPFEVATGNYPRRGDDGRVDFLINPSSDKARYKSDAQGNIDYHETFLIENAYKDSTIAVIKKPTYGLDGKDIYGNVIEAEAGNPITVRVGSNVSFDKKTGKCTAEIDGRVVFEENTISISDTYQVKGDVDMSVGNINFVGKVYVRGNIDGDFSIHGKKEVFIDGRSGPAQISSEGNIFIRGGIAGNGEHTTVKTENGFFLTKYINNCRIEAGGGVKVKNEIVNSTVCTGGAVFTPRGTIVGGSTTALKGINAGTIGSDLGTVTTIGSGLDWTKEDKVHEMKEQLERVQKLLEELVLNVEPIAGDINVVKMYTGKKRSTIKSVVEKLRILQSKKTSLETEIETLEDERHEEAVYQININKVLHNGAVVKIGHLVEQVKDTRNGNMTVIQDQGGEFIRTGPQVNLNTELEDFDYPI